MQALNHTQRANVMIVGVGLMGQHMASNVIEWLKPAKLVLVDHAASINIAGTPTALESFAASLAGDTEVIAETLDVSSEDDVAGLLSRHRDIRYLLYTAGISPRPLVPPEELGRDDVMGAAEVNLWGALNLLGQGIRSGAFTRRAHGVLILSTSATVGSEGRASAAYETSKAGLMNLLQLQSRYFLEEHGLILNGIAPSPLRGPMAAQNPVSAGRLQAVEDTMPIGGLTEPKHIAAATMYFWSDECWCVGEVLTTDGGYTKHRPIYGPISS